MSDIKIPKELIEREGYSFEPGQFPDPTSHDKNKYLAIENGEYVIREIPTSISFEPTGFSYFYASNNDNSGSSNYDNLSNSKNGSVGITVSLSGEVIKRVQFEDVISSGDVIEIQVSKDRKTWYSLPGSFPGSDKHISTESSAGIKYTIVNDRTLNIIFSRYRSGTSSWSDLEEYYWRVRLTKVLNTSIADEHITLKNLKDVKFSNIDNSVLVYDQISNSYSSKSLSQYKLPDVASTGYLKANLETGKYEIDNESITINKISSFLAPNVYHRQCLLSAEMQNDDSTGFLYTNDNFLDGDVPRKAYLTIGNNSSNFSLPDNCNSISPKSARRLFIENDYSDVWFIPTDGKVSIIYEFKNETELTSYSIQFGKIEIWVATQKVLKSIDFLGSNDGIIWTTISSERNLTWSTGEEKHFSSFSATPKYKFYKLEFFDLLASAYINSLVILSKIKFYNEGICLTDQVINWSPLILSFSDGFDQSGAKEHYVVLDESNDVEIPLFKDHNYIFAVRDKQNGDVTFTNKPVNMVYEKTLNFKSWLDISVPRNAIGSTWDSEWTPIDAFYSEVNTGSHCGFYDHDGSNPWVGQSNVRAKLHSFSFWNAPNAANNDTEVNLEYSVDNGQTWQLIQRYIIETTIHKSYLLDIPDYYLSEADQKNGYMIRFRPKSTKTKWMLCNVRLYGYSDYCFVIPEMKCYERGRTESVQVLYLGQFIPTRDLYIYASRSIGSSNDAISSGAHASYPAINMFDHTINTYFQSSTTVAATNKTTNAVWFGSKNLTSKIKFITFYTYSSINYNMSDLKVQYNPTNDPSINNWIDIPLKNVGLYKIRTTVNTWQTIALDDYDLSICTEGTSHCLRIVPTLSGAYPAVIRIMRLFPETCEYIIKNRQPYVQYDSGWFPVGVNTLYTKTHNLGTSDLSVELYWNIFPSDFNKWKVNFYYSGTFGVGGTVRIDNDNIYIGTGTSATYASTNSGDLANSSGGYYRVIAKRNF